MLKYVFLFCFFKTPLSQQAWGLSKQDGRMRVIRTRVRARTLSQETPTKFAEPHTKVLYIFTLKIL